jgi:Flp pilus assembly protein TadD
MKKESKPGRVMAMWTRAVFGTLLAIAIAASAWAGDLEFAVKFPKRSSLTPVQRLNREGVEAIQKNKIDKAKELFYKAYLYDPGDPFTLNNLGYIAELEGQVERAHSFYNLAAGQPTDAVIDRASSSKLKGEPLQAAMNAIQDVPMQINRANVAAVRLLSEGRVFEAESLLLRTLSLDPKNGFTLNNLGVTKEAEGDYNEALRYYNAVADSRSNETVVVTMNGEWRGKSVSDMAASSARKLSARMKVLQNPEAEATLFNLKGVAAMNRNDWRGAWENFSQSYKLNPTNAFSLNNQGYMAELNGDQETAQEFYREAQRAPDAGARVSLATRRDAEGGRLYTIANESEAGVSTAIETASEVRRRNPGPIQLKRRDGTPVTVPPPSPQP